MSFRYQLPAAFLVFAISGSALAQEQAWLQDRRYGEGIGIQTGNFELHPGLAAEFGYDTNFFQRADSEDVQDAFRLRVTPSLTLSTLSERRAGSAPVGAPPMLTLSANLFFSYSEILGSEEVSDQRNFDAGIGARADIAPQRPFGADIYADYLRSGQPSNSPVLDQAFDRGNVRGGAGVSWRPGGGLFDWRLGYELAYAYFEENEFDELNNFQHSVLTRGRWRFLPRTALQYDARYSMVRYQVNDLQPDGDFIEARVGLSGLITSQIAFLALVGWNSSFYEQSEGSEDPGGEAQASRSAAQNYDGYVAHAEVKFFLSPAPTADSVPVGLSSIAVGYQRDFSNSYLGSFYIRDRGYLALNYFLGGVFLARLEGGGGAYQFPRIDERNGSFSQARIDANLFAEYRLSDSFGINTTLSYDQAIGPGPWENTREGEDVSSVSRADRGVLVGEAPDGDIYDDLEFKRFQAFVGVRLFW
jgi:hypothetical protein